MRSLLWCVVCAVGLTSCGGGAGSNGGPTGPSSSTAGVSCTPTTYVPAAGASGSITGDQNDCRGWVDTPGAQFTFTLTQQTNLDFNLSVSGFTPVLALYTENNTTIGFSKGGAPRIVALLPAGTYHISVGSTDNGGRYTLTSTPVTSFADACAASGQPVTIVGATITGSHASSACSTVIFIKGVSVGQTLTFTINPAQAMVFGILNLTQQFPLSQSTVPKNVATTVTYTIPVASEYRVSLFGSGGAPLPIAYTLSVR